MSTFFNPYWLEPGAAVPVDIATTAALVTEIQRLRQALEQPEREWVDLTDEDLALAFHSSGGAIQGVRSVIAKFKEKNTPKIVPQGEPVYYQWRRKNQPWSIRHVYHNKVEATTDDSEVRELYTTPPSIEAAIEAEREACAKVCDDLHHWAASCCAKDIRARGEK